MTRASICACAAFALLASSANAAPGTRRRPQPITRSPALWATVNVCNTALHPRTIGIRGSMPGSGVKQEQMFMRFQVQYRSSANGWSDVPAADSGFVAVGAATFKSRQAGRSFQVAATPGRGYVLRGMITFQWRRAGHAVRRAQRHTTAGHPTSSGADPVGFSKAVCRLP